MLPLHDSHQILAIRLTAWQREIQNVIDWYKNEHDNFHVVDGHMSKWWIHEKSKNIAFQSVRATQVYMEKIYQGTSLTICLVFTATVRHQTFEWAQNTYGEFSDILKIQI